MICFVDCQNCNGEGKRFVLIVPVTIVATAHAVSKVKIEAVPRSNRRVERFCGARDVSAVEGVGNAIVRAARPIRSCLWVHYRRCVPALTATFSLGSTPLTGTPKRPDETKKRTLIPKTSSPSFLTYPM